MKITSNYYSVNLKQGAIPTFEKPSATVTQELYDSQHFKERNYVGLCDKKNRGYNAAYSGSFTGKSEVAANVLNKGLSLGERIMKSDTFAKAMGVVNDHNIASSAFMALILAGILRPATILSLPGKKDKEDKIYSSGHAVASGVIGFVASVILTSPLDAAVKKLFGTREILDEEGNVTGVVKGFDEYGSKRLKEIAEETKKLDSMEQTIDIKKQKRLLKNSKNALKQISKNIPDWIIGIPRSMLTIALIPPILKYVFGVEKKKSAPQSQPVANLNSLATNMKSFDDFRGGLK